MRILVAHNWQIWKGERVENYALSMIRDLRLRGHEVLETTKEPPKNSKLYKGVDLLLDIDCGRDEHGNLSWHGQEQKPGVLSAIYLIDSHGYPSLHRRVAKKYDHVFFAVWNKRELFVNHPSAHWCPNFTDHAWFNGAVYDKGVNSPTDFGFFGSKGGLSRAKELIEIADRRGWTHHVGQINRGERHRWPMTAQAMAKCKYLFNKSQKHDGPNLRVMESMAMKRPLICDQDQYSGLDKLFEPWKHYVPYNYDRSGLEEAMEWCINNSDKAEKIGNQGFEEVMANHLVKHRMDQILEVVNG